jgi:hypothetical protein
MQRVGQGQTIRLDVAYRDGAGDLVDPTTPLLDVLDPDGVVAGNNLVPTRDGTGRYHYSYTLAGDADLGVWTSRWSGTIDDAELTDSDEFEVVVAGALVFYPWRPTVQDVADRRLSRTYAKGAAVGSAGDRVGTFTTETRPTAVQVERIIDAALRRVLAKSPTGAIPSSSHEAARHAAVALAALEVELTYFGEGGEDSPYLQLRQDATAAVVDFVNVANVAALFDEDTPARSASVSGA